MIILEMSEGAGEKYAEGGAKYAEGGAKLGSPPPQLRH